MTLKFNRVLEVVRYMFMHPRVTCNIKHKKTHVTLTFEYDLKIQ